MADELLRGTALDGRARFAVADTTAAVETLREIHDLSPTVTAALGRVATGALLLAATLEKLSAREPVVTVEVEGDGPAGRLVATASPAGWVRGFARNPRASVPARDDGKLDVGAVVGRNGMLTVTRDPGIGEPWRGVVPLQSGEIARDLARYLHDSEQLPSAVGLGVFVVPEGHVTHAGGWLVQLLPGVSEREADDLAERVRQLGPVTARLRAGRGPRSWLADLFPGGFEILETNPVRFACGCSRERVEKALRLLGPREVRSLLEEARRKNEPAELQCEFCRARYPVSPDDLARILRELEEGASR